MKGIRRFRLMAATALFVQAFSSLVMFVILVAKKRTTAFAFLAVSGLCGLGGGWLVLTHRLERLESAADRRAGFFGGDEDRDDEEIDDFSFDGYDEGEEDDFDSCELLHREIPVDDTADETEFDR